MRRQQDLPVIEVTASTPLRAHFDDSDCRKEEGSISESFYLEDEKHLTDPSKNSKPRRVVALLKSVFKYSRDPLPDHSDISFGKTDWRSVGNLLLAIYATLFSGLALAIAICQPRYGKWIGPTGHLSSSNAGFIFSLGAKTIEIASAGVFINLIGQFLTKRSLRSRGITLDDIAVREWLLQPGFVVWHWGNLKYACTTVLGFGSLMAAFAIYFFTTASTMLVSPHISLGEFESTQYMGQVRQNFGNLDLLKSDCWAPIDARVDGQSLGESCANVLASGLANQDMNNYMKSWAKQVTGGGNASSNLNWRPSATSSIFTDTMTQGTWVKHSTSDISASFLKYGRVVNNITLSMPHPVVYYSAQVEFPTPIKGSGFGEHSLQASVVSPTSNTLCINMQESEVAPLVYVEWPNARFNTTSLGQKTAALDWQVDVPANLSFQSNLSATHVDRIFRWGDAYQRKAPVFPQVTHAQIPHLTSQALIEEQWPIDFNSITNNSVPGSDSVYMLFKSPNTTDYTVCQMYGYLSSDCATKQTQKVGARSLTSDCGSNALSFGKAIAPETFDPGPSTSYRDVIGSWAIGMGLNSGLISSNNSIVHVLSQFVVTNSSNNSIPSLDPTMPSLAEALAVLSNSMLLKASINTTFDNRTIEGAPIPATYFPYNVIVQTQEYRSGPPAAWQGILYPILAIMFLSNLYCLTYFFREMGLVVDFLEPENLFSVAIHSPSESKRRATSEGPVVNHGDQAWTVRRDHDRRFVFKKVGVEGSISNGRRDGRVFTGFAVH